LCSADTWQFISHSSNYSQSAVILNGTVAASMTATCQRVPPGGPATNFISAYVQYVWNNCQNLWSWTKRGVADTTNGSGDFNNPPDLYVEISTYGYDGFEIAYDLVGEEAFCDGSYLEIYPTGGVC